MPNKDGTGPLGHGPITGRGIGRQGPIGSMRSGPGGYCVCPKCGEKIAHMPSIPCTSVKCPKCGSFMIRVS